MSSVLGKNAFHDPEVPDLGTDCFGNSGKTLSTFFSSAYLSTLFFLFSSLVVRYTYGRYYYKVSLCIVGYDRLVKQTYAQLRKLFIEHLLYAGTIFHIFNTLLFFSIFTAALCYTAKKKNLFFPLRLRY